MNDTDRPARPRAAAPTVLATGLVIGALDITFAWAFWALKAGVGPQRIFQSVAAGVLGKAAREGGVATAALGLALQIFIATSIAAVYYLAARRLPALWRKPWPYGMAYGIVVYLVMRFVVVPLSAAGSGSKDALWIALSILVHVFLVGLPSALAARRLLAPAATAAG